MNGTETLAHLKKVGTAQNAKIFRRHGCSENVYGVSFAELSQLKKKIGTDHALAVDLWKSGNTDARTLALLIADAAALTWPVAREWLSQEKYPGILDYLAALVARTSFAEEATLEWTRSPDEFVRTCGHGVLSARLKNGGEISDKELRDHLSFIEREIHGSPNRARHAMNMALIAAGCYRPDFRKSVLEAAKKIGKIAVDHGETACKTPEAASYIAKFVAREKDAPKASSKKKSADCATCRPRASSAKASHHKVDKVTVNRQGAKTAKKK